ncbi:hypothetical protein N4T42_07070 [Riemerella anatipestifer]|uniref:hypothetical protein n=1 Tax=Riemerella anatipestifer TaxID=34085 RepID=UPI0021D5D2E5|nr:hypothetical protein [Riemerella anatipestifer]MCU7560048.1 hypothetical protein [Riemerella anatipestifer]MDY3440813.1 hypothetical protein [Riemerella anatipestifer]
MPNRIIRDWTDSERINELSFQAEVLFTRLLMKADDLGGYHANPRLIKAFCFPLKNIRESDITRWLDELVSAGIIALYNADNKPYLHIINFGQRLRQVKPKFPKIPEKELNEFMSATCQQPVSGSPPETETETEESGNNTTPQKSFKNLTEKEFRDSLMPFLVEYSKDLVRDFYEYWTEPSANGTPRFKLEKTWNTERRLKTWARNESKFGKTQTTPVKRKRNEL